MESKDQAKELERIDLPITGMSCASCALKIEKGLAGVEGVSKATINFAAEKATVVFHPEQTDLSHLIDKVKDLGYGAKSEKVLLPIQGMTCASCVNKVEKALNSARGVVHADVNFATERASVEYIPEEVSIRDLKKVVEGNQFLPSISISDSCSILDRLAVLCWVLEGDETQNQRYEHIDRCRDLCGLSVQSHRDFCPSPDHG